MQIRKWMRSLLAGAAVLTLAGCFGGGPQVKEDSGSAGGGLPAWVTSPPSGGGYAYGVGSAEVVVDPASALNRAQDKARSELLKRLEVTVSAETTSRSQREVSGGESQVTRSLMDTVRSRVAETELANIEISETHVDKGGGTAYALARLNRTQAEMELGNELQSLDKRVREVAQSDPGGDRLDRLKALMPALPLLAERKGLYEKLQLVAEGDPGHRRPAEFRELQGTIADLLDSLVVVLQPKGEGSRKMDSTLRRALSEEGVQVREGGSGDLVLRYEAGLRSVDRDGRHFVFADGNVTVLDASGNVIDEFQNRVKAGSVNPDVASDRALARLAEGLGEKLGASLLKSFERAAGRS